MKILVACPLHPLLVESGLGPSIVDLSRLTSPAEDVRRSTLVEAVAAEKPDAVLIDADQQRDAVFTDFRGAVVVRKETGFAADLRALGAAERRVSERRAQRRLADCGISRETNDELSGARVVFVGAGIVNLMAALETSRRGADVEILEASPDPRTRPPWQDLGATHGGDDARMFTFTEANNYSESRSSRRGLFQTTVADAGRLLIDPQALSAAEQTWIRRFETTPRWRAEVFAEDIHGFNLAADPLWRQLRRSMPRLFADVGMIDDVLSIYSEPEKAAAAEDLHRRLGSLIRTLRGDELLRKYPMLRPAIADERVAGAFEVRGFTLQIHRFAARLLEHLEARGVRLRWNQPATAIRRADDGRIDGLETVDGTVRAEHYVLSPGTASVAGGELLRGLRSAEKIQGILGSWLTLPDVEPRLARAIKLHREGTVGEDSNVIPSVDAQGRRRLLLGSGYGFLGRRPLDMNSPHIRRLEQALDETARRYFPAAFEAARREGLLDRPRKACVRPFTSTGLGLFEVLPTTRGGRLVVAGGHNTGGFAQSPVVAEAVAATLAGRPHPMQTLYDPERGVDDDP